MRTGILLMLFFSISAVQSCKNQPDSPAITLTAGDLSVTFVDNQAVPPHRAGYNGIAALQHKHLADSIFVPLYAGFNLEHIFSGDSMAQKFEPRAHPMKLSQTGENSV